MGQLKHDYIDGKPCVMNLKDILTQWLDLELKLLKETELRKHSNIRTTTYGRFLSSLPAP